ncbi:Flp pilus assembly complex ATPase component TadA [Mycetocola spongiae]|nr:Flp pilus assembly complex ATPase component TadA [Mycetocola spongiae]
MDKIFLAAPVLAEAVPPESRPAPAVPSGLPAPGSAPREALGQLLEPPPARLRLALACGWLGPYLLLPGITDLCISVSTGLWFDIGAGLTPDPSARPTESGLRALAVRLIALGGRHLDEASPCVDVRLSDGVRVHAVLPPVAPLGTAVSIRLPSARPLRVEALAAAGFFGPAERSCRAAVLAAVRGRQNILISGSTGAGKTTLLAALLGEADPGERIIAVEDVSELRVEHPQFTPLQARQANVEGAGGLSVRRLLREALRMRPDRLVLGECRGEEVRELLSALNTGHDGGAGTIHANSLADVPARLEALGALAGLSARAVAGQARSAIGLLIHLDFMHSHRRVGALGCLGVDARGRLGVQPEWSAAA